MYLMWKENNKPIIKVVSHKRTVSSKKTTRQFTKFFILQNQTELKRYDLYWIKMPTIKITLRPVLV